VSEQFLNGTSAHYRLLSARKLDEHKIMLTLITIDKKRNAKPGYPANTKLR